MNITRTLRKGVVGDDVRFLQRGVNALLPRELPALVVDGIFGDKTHTRVHKFQSVNSLAADGIVGAQTLRVLFDLLQKVMNPFTVTMRAGSPENYSSKDWFVIPGTVPGKGSMGFTTKDVKHNFRIYRVDGLNKLHWFSVVTPVGHVGSKPTCVLSFMPDVGQGNDTKGFTNGEYEAMAAGSRWEGVLRAYSQVMGSQMIASDPTNMVLVIPLRPMSVGNDLGEFNVHWKAVCERLVTDAVMREDPFAIRTDALTLDRVITASYSSGINVHQNFVGNAVGLDAVRASSIEIDGIGGWGAKRSKVFKEDHPEFGGHFFTQGRWGKLPAAAIARHRIKSTHWQIAQYMLHAGLSL